MLDYIDYRFKEWSRWLRRGCGSGLGYGKQTIEADLIEMGGVLISGKGAKPPIESHPRAEQIERGVRGLEPELRKLAVVRYLSHGSKKAKAKKLKCSVAKYYRDVDSLHFHMQGFLDVEREKENFLEITESA